MAIGAFFDIDNTVLEVNSGTKWIGYQWKTGQLTAWQLGQALLWLGQYRFGLLDYDAMARKVLARYQGDAVQPIYEEVAAWFEREVRWAICSQAREAIESHRAQGHTLVLLTSATPFLSQPVAELLDVPHVLCTKLEVTDGKLTGKHFEPACYGPGKVTHAEAFAAVHDVDLDVSYFYSDSISDLPMLERVGHAHVINPDPRLGREAHARRWPITTWTAEGEPPKR
ncbi:MAG: HAD-IB family hydrolase [Nannocystaceae bacterium]|nr:HAD-IB family hydrolase [Nannocystaceae bacterium]